MKIVAPITLIALVLTWLCPDAAGPIACAVLVVWVAAGMRRKRR